MVTATSGPISLFQLGQGVQSEGPRDRPHCSPEEERGGQRNATFPRTSVGFNLWSGLDNESIKGENHVNKHRAVMRTYKDKEALSTRKPRE